MAKKAAKKVAKKTDVKPAKGSKVPAKKAAKKKATDKPVKSPTVSIEVQRELDHLHQIQKMNVTVQRYAEQYEADKAEAAISKKALDNAAASLSELIKNGPPKPDPQKKLPFDSPDDGEVVDAEFVVVDADAWKKIPIGDALKLSEKERDKLAEYDIKTVGDFEHVRGRGDRQLPNGLSSMKGVGEAKITKWEAEMIEWQTAYFKANPQPEPGDKKKRTPPPDNSATSDVKTGDVVPPAEWQLMALDTVTKLSKKHIGKLAEQGVATLGTLHLIMTGQAEQFPNRLESLDLPSNTIKALDVDVRQLFVDMGIATDGFETQSK